MKESLFGFQYSWEEVQPIRPLVVTYLVAEFVGAALGVWFDVFPDGVENVWAGVALAAFPGFLLGLPIQAYLRPGMMSEKRGMVLRIGVTALILSALAFVVPLGRNGR